MKTNFTEIEYSAATSTQLLSCICYNCNNEFQILKKNITQELKNNRGRNKFCTWKCRNEYKFTKKYVNCANCNIKFLKQLNQIKKSKNNFCSRSCNATYNNTHKTTGNRRSKLEQYLEIELTKLYSNLDIQFNNKEIINSELDIYIPSLKLAFELNGIFHYEPIFGGDKLNQIQNNDQRKFQACLEQGIELCIIDTSRQINFKEKSSQKYLQIIFNIINFKLNI